MKKVFTILVFLFGIGSLHAQTATNFTCNDCNGGSHDLFTELDAGKVIVLIWVMPCGACTSPSVTSYNVVNGYQSSHPGRVFLYMADDVANSTCTTINGWANGIGVPQNAYSLRFSNADINMADYGSAGMPKIVVLGGTTHTVFYNVNNAVNSSALQNAIDAALSSTGINELALLISELNIYPNPADDKSMIQFALAKPSPVNIELFNMEGKKIQQVFSGKMDQGKQEVVVNTARLSAGMYLVKFTSDGKSNYMNIAVVH